MSTFKAERFLSGAGSAAVAGRRNPRPPAVIATDDAIALYGGGDLRRRVRVPLTDDAVADTAALKAARRDLAPAASSTPELDCALLTRHLHIFPLTLVGDAAQARDAAVVAQVRSRLSYPLSDAVIDYHVLPESVQRQGDDGVNVLVYAVHRPVVDRLLDRLSGARWIVGRLLTAGDGLAPLPADEGRRLLVASTRSTLALSVIEDHVVLMERIVPWGVDRLVAMVAERLDLPPDVARRLLHGDVGEADLITTTRTVREILEPAYRDLVREATACLGYCTSTLKPRRTSDFWLVGPLAHAPGFASVLKAETGAARADLWEIDSGDYSVTDAGTRAEALRHAFEEEEVGS